MLTSTKVQGKFQISCSSLAAIEEKKKRVNLREEKLQELILDGTIMIDIDGQKVGQVNGLATYALGDHNFGKPSKISCVTSYGKAGIIVSKETCRY
jgi:predicted ATP-dependent protease